MGPGVIGGKPVVLVVEDEVLVRAVAIDMVEQAGFEVIEACDADKAIRILESRQDIRAVFTDVQMPGSMDGLRLARAVRDRWPPVALIVTSGLANLTDDDLPPGGAISTKTLLACGSQSGLARIGSVILIRLEYLGSEGRDRRGESGRQRVPVQILVHRPHTHDNAIPDKIR